MRTVNFDDCSIAMYRMTLISCQPLGKWRLRGLLLLLLINVSACQSPDPPVQLSVPPADLDSRLTLDNATLEQSNRDGQTLWKIQVKKATYSQDRKVAQLEKVRGNIYQNGKVVLQINADRGEVYKKGEEVFLKDNIVAIDPRNKAVIRSQEMEWRPKEGLLMVRKDLKGSHSKLEATAKEGKYYTEKQRLELVGNIIATAKEPRIQLKTEHLFWELSQEKAIGDRPLTIERYKDNAITDRVSANRGEVALKTYQVTISENVEYRSIDPPIQIAANQVTWNYKDRYVRSDTPAQLFHSQDRMLVTGNRTSVDLARKVAYLRDGVQALNQVSQAKLYSQQLIWKIADKLVEAEGNVIYEQADPKLNLTGEKAVGTFKDDNIVVSGNSQDRVVTEIFPESVK